jgi:hypothetical protein
MKGIISKTPVTIADRKGTRQANVFISITEDRRNFLGKFRELIIHDFEVVPRDNPQQGEPLNDYLVLEENKKKLFYTEVENAWVVINKDILGSSSLENQMDQFYVDLLLKEAQDEPLRDSSPENWEYHDTETTIQPE